MSTNTKISTIEFEQLDAACLVQVSKFARAIYRINGTLLKLQDKNIIAQIIQHNSNVDNTELHTIYTQLQLAIVEMICRPHEQASLLKFTSNTTQKHVNE